jgi:hypothetical protein
MDVSNSALRYQNAAREHSEAIDRIKALERPVKSQDVRHILDDERAAWSQLQAKRRQLLDAVLESLGLEFLR